MEREEPKRLEVDCDRGQSGERWRRESEMNERGSGEDTEELRDVDRRYRKMRRDSASCDAVSGRLHNT
jgi:hypothetical protein